MTEKGGRKEHFFFFFFVLVFVLFDPFFFPILSGECVCVGDLAAGQHEDLAFLFGETQLATG